MNSLYTYFEEERPITLSRKDWLKWFKKYGDKENFVDEESWFSEMLYADSYKRGGAAVMNFYDTCQLDLINIEPEKQIELIPVDHKRKQKRQIQQSERFPSFKLGLCAVGFFVGMFLYYIAVGY